jgi:hypothetical protein
MSNWQIYLSEIPYSKNEKFWVSFESDPGLTKTKANIYGRCLPCIENLYDQLQRESKEITLGNAFNCWKITAVVKNIEKCIRLLSVFEKKYPQGHVYGKFGSSRADTGTKVVVFHAESPIERDRLGDALQNCLGDINQKKEIQISRACAILYESILGDWQFWQPTTPINFPENVEKQKEILKRIIHTSRM